MVGPPAAISGLPSGTSWAGWTSDTGAQVMNPATRGVRWNPRALPQTYGGIDCRYGGRAVTTLMDGHGESLSLDEFRDMRRWSHKATSENWTFDINAR
jgi:hypothetical protein